MSYKLEKKDGVVNPVNIEERPEWVKAWEETFSTKDPEWKDNYTPNPDIENQVLETPKEGFKGIFIGRMTPQKTSADWIYQEVGEIGETLIEKNRKYGDSIFSEGLIFDVDPELAMKARLNDKFARLKNDNNDEDEDITKDIIGYLILWRIYQKKKKSGY
jgi:hypothetical protein